MQLAAPTEPTDADVTAHCAALEDPDIVGDLHVAADTLHSHGTLRVTYGDVAGDALHPHRPARALDLHVAADRLRVDGALARHGDVEVHPEPLPTEHLQPAALLLVEVRLDEDVVPSLLDADLDVLEKPLRPIGASAFHTLPSDDSHLPSVAYVDVGLARDVAHTKTRHALHDERLLDGLVVALTGVLVHPDKRRAHRAGDLVRIDIDVHVEAVPGEPERVALFVPGAARLASLFALALAISSLAVSLELPLRAVALTLLFIAPALVILRIERHEAGSRSKSEAASSGAMRPSASSRRISLRRSASRSGTACEGKPSARIMASSRERTVGYEMPSSRSTSLKLPRARMNTSRNSSCSGASAWNRPRENEPSRRVPQLSHSSRTTRSCSEQMGHRATTGLAMDRRCAPT